MPLQVMFCDMIGNLPLNFKFKLSLREGSIITCFKKTIVIYKHMTWHYSTTIVSNYGPAERTRQVSPVEVLLRPGGFLHSGRKFKMFQGIQVADLTNTSQWKVPGRHLQLVGLLTMKSS